MIRKVRFVLCVAVLFLAQAALVHRFSYRFLQPDLLYLTAAFLALEADYKGALWGAFALGILRDLGSSGAIGASPLIFIPASMGLLFVRDHIRRDSALTDLLLTFAYVLSGGLVYAVIAGLFGAGHPTDELVAIAFGQALFTAALSPLFFVGFTKIGLVRSRA